MLLSRIFNRGPARLYQLQSFTMKVRLRFDILLFLKVVFEIFLFIKVVFDIFLFLKVAMPNAPNGLGLCSLEGKEGLNTNTFQYK